jgi:hypothetical protein
MAWYRARQRRDAHSCTSFVIERMPLGNGPSKALPPRYLRLWLVQRMRGSHRPAGVQNGHRSERRDARRHRAVHPLVLDGAANATTLRPKGSTAATHKGAHIRVIFERHESLPMASGSVALSGAMGMLDPEVKVGSIVLVGGTIEQKLTAGLQPSPEVPYMQLHVKPPIVIESTSPAANQARLRRSTGEAQATGRAPTVAVRGRGRGKGCGGGSDGAGGADRRVVGVGSTRGIPIQNTVRRRLGAAFGVG